MVWPDMGCYLLCQTHTFTLVRESIFYPSILVYVFFCDLYQLFYLGYVSPLFFISEEAENALKQDSTSLLPACALKVTRSLSPQFSLDFNSPAKLFTSTASKLIE